MHLKHDPRPSFRSKVDELPGWLLAVNFCQGVDQDKLGIYIKQVVKDGPAAKVS